MLDVNNWIIWNYRNVILIVYASYIGSLDSIAYYEEAVENE